MKKPNKSKESIPGVKSLNRIASQKVITHVGEGEVRKHQRHNSMNANLLLSGKSSDKNQKLIKQYSTLNKKVIEKIQCKTQENSESLENNGKTQRTERTALLTSNMISKANLSKIKLKIPNKSKGSKPASTKNMLINSNENKEHNLVDSLKKEVLRLNQDNKKLRDELEEAKSMNLKFKDFATDLMRFYEKPGKIETKKK